MERGLEMRSAQRLPIVLLVCALLLGCAADPNRGEQTSINSENALDYSVMDLATVYYSLEEIVRDSDLIAEVSLEHKNEVISYGGADFSLTTANIVDVIYGDSMYSDQEINILELQSMSMTNTSTSEGNQFILFLDRYEGPAYEKEAFVITGIYQGKFDISDSIVEYKAAEFNGVSTFQSQLTPNSVDDFKAELGKVTP